MEPFRRVEGIAAPLPIANVDTDMILSAAFLKTVSREGLARGLFYALRFDAEGRERDFVLNRTPWTAAKILVALENFGCGSSREHAPWALLDFGIRAVIAPSFAEIFHGNCFKCGILPVTLPRATIDRLMAAAGDASTAVLSVDLETQTIDGAGERIDFSIDPLRRERLLAGTDDIAAALTCERAIRDHEQQVERAAPWLADPRLAPVS